MPFKKFVHLHVHTEYSLLDGACRIDALVKQARALKMPALAITDHGVLYGAINFYDKCLKHGVKPIIGMEAYVAPGSRMDKKSNHGMRDAANHLVLLAKDFEGYQNLVALSSIGFLQGFYYRPRIDKEVLAAHSKGLIALSACLHGELAMLIQKNEMPIARQMAEEYVQLFGEGNFYIEMMDQHVPGQGDVNRGLADLSRETGIPLVATNDVHYLRREDALAHEVLMCLQTGTTLNDEKRMRFPSQEFYLKSGEEMESLFHEHPEAAHHTTEIANHCNLELPSGYIQLPNYPIADQEQSKLESITKGDKHDDLDAYMERLCRENIPNRYTELNDQIEERLQQECAVIKKMGYAAYFLIVWDFIKYARSCNIPVGPGRGSAAGSLVAYLLEITEIDPIEYGLIFERFLNPERISMPDIDVDIADTGRDAVIQYVTEKYGQENVAQIITFGTMAARAAVRDVGRVLNIAYDVVDKTAKMIPHQPDMTISRALETVPELRIRSENDGHVNRLLSVAQTLEGQVRHASTHAAGVVISKDPLLQLVPLCHTKTARSGEGGGQQGGITLTSQYAMDALERLGLLKMDFLGLRTLTVIDDAVKAIEHTTSKHLDLKELPLNDQKTFDLLASGQTGGIFQLESAGMRDLLKRLKPKSLKEICALIALYRPGPMAIIDEFIMRKQGKLPIRYPHPELEDILSETFGTIVYQEQVMQIAVRLGQFTYGQADILRRAMGKKNRDLIEQQRGRFIQGAMKRKIDEDTAERIFDLMAKFGEYGFNKSHSLAYALLAYQTAYLKANYPNCFMAAMLTSEMHNTDKIALYIGECKRLTIKIGLPDVNSCKQYFVAKEDSVCFGLAAIKNVGFSAAKAIADEHKANGDYKDLEDFCSRVDLRSVNQRAIESLIKAGAFDVLGEARQNLLLRLPADMATAQKIQAEQDLGQMAMFDILQTVMPNEPVHSAIETERERLADEKDVLGFYLTGHPLAEHQQLLTTFSTITMDKLDQLNEGQALIVGGEIIGMKHSMTKRKEPMLRFTLENMEGLVEVIVWPDVLGSHKSYLVKNNMIFIVGRIDRTGDDNKVIATDVVPLQEAYATLSKEIHLTIHPTLGEEQLKHIRDTISHHHGSTKVVMHVWSEHHGEVVERLPERFNVHVTDAVLAELKKQMDESAISIVGPIN